MQIECTARTCAHADCANRRFARREYSPMEVRSAGAKGFGMFALADIAAGSFLMEYVGDVITFEHCCDRLTRSGKHMYAMGLTPQQFIDASIRGNEARFINHSCDPNAETQKWQVGKETRVGLFAVRDIAAGEEISFDYCYEQLGGEHQVCYCGAPNCRHFL
jgi:SET domain-containing protein